ncbi:MAG: DUF3199 family protein [Lachnospiraceae bacterium]|nr:DUF3199 family protein [Lachnospiraceae bacterium]
MERPWVTPQQVKAYTDITAVSERSVTKLQTDIARAEQYVISYTHNDFSDTAYASSMPSEVILAIILLAEAYANQAIMAAKQSGVIAQTGKKSETFDDYSYTMSDSTSELDISTLNLPSLLDAYVIAEARGAITFRMRRL